MKKKLLFGLACVTSVLMTSCFEETGYSQTMDFARVVTIDRNSVPLQLVADYTGETFKLSNLTSVEQLSLYDLQDTERAIARIHFEVDDSYTAKWTLSSADPVKISLVWNKPLPEAANFGPLTDLFRLQLDNWSYPLSWLAGKYLNLAPVVRSMGRGTYYLQPAEAFGDTLRFDMLAEYTPATTSADVVDFINFDLSTLADTANADAKTTVAVRDMLGTIAANDSVMVMVVANYRTKGHLGTDTVVKWPSYAGYSKVLKSLVK